jgi:hypothetical protein
MKKLRRGAPHKPGRKPLYPWVSWFGKKGDTTLIEHGVDFETEIPTMEVIVRRKASQMGLKISVYTEPTGLILVNRGKKK